MTEHEPRSAGTCIVFRCEGVGRVCVVWNLARIGFVCDGCAAKLGTVEEIDEHFARVKVSDRITIPRSGMLDSWRFYPDPSDVFGAVLLPPEPVGC